MRSLSRGLYRTGGRIPLWRKTPKISAGTLPRLPPSVMSQLNPGQSRGWPRSRRARWVTSGRTLTTRVWAGESLAEKTEEIGARVLQPRSMARHIELPTQGESEHAQTFAQMAKEWVGTLSKRSLSGELALIRNRWTTLPGVKGPQMMSTYRWYNVAQGVGAAGAKATLLSTGLKQLIGERILTLGARHSEETMQMIGELLFSFQHYAAHMANELAQDPSASKTQVEALKQLSQRIETAFHPNVSSRIMLYGILGVLITATKLAYEELKELCEEQNDSLEMETLMLTPNDVGALLRTEGSLDWSAGYTLKELQEKKAIFERMEEKGQAFERANPGKTWKSPYGLTLHHVQQMQAYVNRCIDRKLSGRQPTLQSPDKDTERVAYKMKTRQQRTAQRAQQIHLHAFFIRLTASLAGHKSDQPIQYPPDLSLLEEDMRVLEEEDTTVEETVVAGAVSIAEKATTESRAEQVAQDALSKAAIAAAPAPVEIRRPESKLEHLERFCQLVVGAVAKEETEDPTSETFARSALLWDGGIAMYQLAQEIGGVTAIDLLDKLTPLVNALISQAANKGSAEELLNSEAFGQMESTTQHLLRRILRGVMQKLRRCESGGERPPSGLSVPDGEGGQIQLLPVATFPGQTFLLKKERLVRPKEARKVNFTPVQEFAPNPEFTAESKQQAKALIDCLQNRKEDQHWWIEKFEAVSDRALIYLLFNGLDEDTMEDMRSSLYNVMAGVMSGAPTEQLIEHLQTVWELAEDKEVLQQLSLYFEHHGWDHEDQPSF